MHQARYMTLADPLGHSNASHRSIAGGITPKAIALLLVVLLSVIATPCLGEITDQDILSLAYDGTTAVVEAPESTGIGGLMARLIFSLAAVFGLILLVARLAKKYLPRQAMGLGGNGNAIQVLATRAIGARKNLMLVQVEGKKVLLGVTPQNLQFLTNVDGDDLEWGDAAQDAGIGQAAGRRSDIDAVHA